MLKTDYRDAMYEGQRRYRMIANEDGTYCLPDVTAYTQEGDRFGANDINATNDEINKLVTVRTAVLLASGWSATAPYTQTVYVSGITTNDNPAVSLFIPEEATAVKVKAWNKALGMVDEGVTGDGQIIFRCYNKKPSVDFTVTVKGV